MHWAGQYVGKPWKPGEYGPEFFDCWGLVWHVATQHYGIQLPKFQGCHTMGLTAMAKLITHEIFDNWKPLQRPKDGCCVAMSQGGPIHHVGIYVQTDGGVVLHSNMARGTVAQSIAATKASGYRRLEFYEWSKSLK